MPISLISLQSNYPAIETPVKERTRWFGLAHMLKDGTIIIDSHAMTEDGTVIEGRDRFRPDNKAYKEILNHIVGLKPGEEKTVPPWKD